MASNPVSGTSTPKVVIKQSSKQRSSHDCRTKVSHTSPPTCDLTSSKTSVNRSPDCSTSVSHRRHVGLWRRGAIYQYRVRVPADLRPLVGTSHINRSLGTASFTVAIRSVRTMAYDVERQFDTIRTNGGQPDCRIVGVPDGQSMAVAIPSVRASNRPASKSTATISSAKPKPPCV
jgi:hypothetical protein